MLQVAAVVVALAFCAVFIVAVIQWDEHPALARWAVWLLFPLAAAFNLMFHGVNVGGGVVWIYVSSAVGWAVPDRRWAVRAVFGVAACYLFFGWLGHDDISDMLITLIPVVFVGITMSGFRVQMKLMWELRQAREEVAKHAASEERLRLARDMHDLTGQSLSMITLKSELAARLLERLPEGPDRDRVADEIQQVAAVQPADPARHPRGDQRVPAPDARGRDDHRPHRPGERGDRAARRPGAHAAVRHVQPGRGGGAGLVPARGGHERDPPLGREELLHPPHPPRRDADALAPGPRRRPRMPGREPRPREAADRPAEPAEIQAGTGTGLHGMSERLCAVGGGLELRPGAHGFCLVATVPVAPVVSAAAGVTVTT